MIKRKKVKKPAPLDLTPYVDQNTGELLTDKLIDEKSSITITKDTGMSVISYSDYSVIETEAIMVLSQLLNNSDLANVIKMAVVVKTPLSIVFNNKVPHTKITLQKYLEIKSEAMYINLIKRLVKVGVLYQMKGFMYGEVRMCYIINPYICRKRRVFENTVLDIFKQFNKDMYKSIEKQHD